MLSRPPTAAEQSACEKFLAGQAALLADPKNLHAASDGPTTSVAPSPDPKMRAREGLILVLLNHNDFVTIR